MGKSRNAFVLVIALIVMLAPQVSTGQDIGVGRDAKTPSNKQQAKDFRKVLEDTKLSKLSFVDEPLNEVLALLGNLISIDFVLSSTLREKGAEISLTLNTGTSAKDLLSILEKSAGIRFYVVDGIVMVYDKDEIVEKTKLEIYYVESMQIAVQDNPGPSIGFAKDSSGGIGLDRSEWTKPKTKQGNFDIEELPDMIRNLTGKNNYWDRDERAVCEVRMGNLFVVAIPSVHKEIKSLLEKLRQ